MANFGELVLIVSDLHIPFRILEIPAKFKAMLVPKKFQHIICVGNMCTSEQVDFFKDLCHDVHIVRGDYDEFAGDYPYEDRFTIKGWTFGLTHGHQLIPNGNHVILENLARKLDCNILISGATHKMDVFKKDHTLFMNPGSLTGAFTPDRPDNNPSFILLGIKEEEVIVFTYELVEGELKVKKTIFKKEDL